VGGAASAFSRDTDKDVKNEGCSSEFIENKGAKKVLLRVYRKQTSYTVFPMTS
jgi:hypothetical protein